MPDPQTINMVDRNGVERAVPADQVDYHAQRGWKMQSAEAHAAGVADRVEEDIYGGAAGAVLATGAGLARGFTGGLSDAGLAALGGGETLDKLRRQNEVISTGSEIVGGLSGAGKLAGRAGARLAGSGGGTAAQIGRAGVAGAAEGAILGAGQGVSELALSSDPLTMERVASVIGSNAAFGAATGGVLNVGGKVVERGLVRAKAALDETASKKVVGALGEEIPEDLATLDRKGLRAAEKAELEAIEAARVPQRAQLADEVKALRTEMKEQKVWLATKGAEAPEIRAIGKRTLKADRQLDNLLDDPKALAENPKAALSGLRKQEAALDELVNKHGPKLRETFAADTSGTRAQALDFAAAALEKNRALQSKLTELSAKPTSQRLQQIADATDALSTPKPEASFGQQMLQGSVFGHVAGAVGNIPLLGPMIGAKAAKLASNLVGGKLGNAASEAAARGSKAVQTFLDVGRKAAPTVRIAATKTLTNVAFAPRREESAKKAKAPAPTLTAAYKARESEIRNLTAPGPNGAPQMRPAARQQLAANLKPIAAADPLLADAIESTKARGVEFLAAKLPRRPDVFGMQVGPDRWQPSDMEMRTWARYVAAVEDPNGVIERLADGSVTPEDAETIRTVYPQLYADIQRQIVEQLPTLQRTLPYQRRLAYSIFSDIPVDPTLHPVILTSLQQSFEVEQGTSGGIEAPRAQPQFGSVSRETGTPSQQREEGTQ